MTHAIRPTEPDDLPALSRFLTEGFHAPADADFAAVDVLRWKYFDPRGGADGPRSYLALDEGEIIGHVGLCPARFQGPGLPPEGVSTVHMIDWFSARPGSSIGAYLMLRAHRGTETQYGFGGSQAGRSVIDRGGYQLVARVPVYQKVLRPGYRLRAGGPRKLARWLRDLARMVLRRGRRPGRTIELRPVDDFGPEVEPVLDAYRSRAVFTSRDPALLNHVLRYPRPCLSGWRLVDEGRLAGFAVLSLVRQGKTHVGKVVDCVLDDPDPALWHAAIDALTGELRRQGADVALGFGSTPWMARALEAAGYRPLHDLEFRLRDKGGLVPRQAPFHLTPLEADYAYT